MATKPSLAARDTFQGLLRCGRRAESTFGYEFNIDAPVWRLCKDVSVNIRALCELADVRLRDGLVATLAHLARTWSPAAVSSSIGALKKLFIATGGQVSELTLINYRASLTRHYEWHLGSARTVLKKWHALGYPGMDDEVIDLLNSWALSGSIKGDAVKRRDPIEGPFTENELLAFNEGVVRAYECGDLSLRDLCLCLLTSHSGRRPRQLAYMKVCDIEGRKRNSKDESVYFLMIPRLKQKGGSFRTQLRKFYVTPELAQLLMLQKAEAIAQSEALMGFRMQESDGAMLPLFPDSNAVREVKSVGAYRSLASTDRLHICTRVVNDAIQAAVRLSKIQSERTGVDLVAHSRRFRYTVGSRAAKEGCGLAVIAELLDHTDTQNVGVYTKSSPEHLVKIDAAVGHQLAPLARAFQGRLVDHESHAQRSDEPSSRVRHKGVEMATCGFGGHCAAWVPIPCYTCQHFQPWLDGPHQRVLDELLRDKQCILDETGDDVIAAINDRTILAVCEVIQRCNDRRLELEQSQCR